MGKGVLVVLSFILLISLSFSVYATINASDVGTAASSNGSANRSSQSTTIAANNLAQGGNTTQVNLTVTDITDKWQGYFGETNGSVILGAGNLVFYNFGTLKSNMVFATMDPSFNWATISNDTNAQGAQNITGLVDRIFFNTTGDDPRTHVDSANRTYTGRNKIGGILGVASVTLNPAASGFFSGIFQNGTLNETTQLLSAADARKFFAFGVNVTSDANDFLGGGHTSDYELMVPVPTSANTYSTATYYFFMDIE